LNDERPCRRSCCIYAFVDSVSLMHCDRRVSINCRRLHYRDARILYRVLQYRCIVSLQNTYTASLPHIRTFSGHSIFGLRFYMLLRFYLAHKNKIVSEASIFEQSIAPLLTNNKQRHNLAQTSNTTLLLLL